MYKDVHLQYPLPSQTFLIGGKCRDQVFLKKISKVYGLGHLCMIWSSRKQLGFLSFRSRQVERLVLMSKIFWFKKEIVKGRIIWFNFYWFMFYE